MTNNMQLHANYGTIDQAAGDIGTHTGNTENERANVKQICGQIIGNLAGGEGSEQHNQVMREVDRLYDEHVRNLQTQQSGTANAGDTMVSYGKQMSQKLGTTAI